jgi:uncharacterized protein
LIYQRGNELIPIEIKSSRTYNASFIKGINSFKKIASDRCAEAYLVYSGDEEMKIGEVQLLNYRHAARIVG